MRNSGRVARVVIDSRLPQLTRVFDYLAPGELDIAQGMRVRVPLRHAKKLAEGWVVEMASASDHPGKLAEVASAVSPVPVLPERLWHLARAVASRSAGNPADVLRLAIPKRYVKVESSWWRDGAALVAKGVTHVGASGHAPGVDTESLLAPGARTSLALPYGVTETPAGVSLPASIATVAMLAAEGLSRGTSVVVVCPDWRDIEHARSALLQVVAEDVVCDISTDVPPAQRYANYLRTLEPSPVVVLGSRHAVYAPAHDVGLVIVVDDADSAHREPLAPYPHTRDIALMRNTLDQTPVCFASVARSLAVQRWVDMSYISEHAVSEAKRPRVIPTSLTLRDEGQASPARLPSSVYQAVKDVVTRGPVLFQVFRTGFSPGLSCASCGIKASCPHCGGPLRQASAGAQPSCLWCGVSALRWSCPDCSHSMLRPRGQGIGRTVSDLGKSFPAVPIIQSDGEHKVSSVARTPALVIATRGAEPVTPGGYELVVLLDGAAMLQRDSLGALEESIHAWEHAISLASRDSVCFVTELDGPPALALAAGNWTQLVRHELTQRSILKLPPTVRIASLSGPAKDVESVRDAIQALSPQIDALGPVATPGGGVLTVLRFPYASGDAVVAELSAWRQRLASGPRRTSAERVKIVVDDAVALDTLAGE